MSDIDWKSATQSATARAERAEAALRSVQRMFRLDLYKQIEDGPHYNQALKDVSDRVNTALSDAPASAPGPDVRQVLAQFAVRLGQWKDEHHDCDCPPHHSCGCQELRGIIQEMELYNFTETDALAMLSPASAPGDGWLPIESAPKDGTRVILASFEGVWMGEYIAQYQSGYQVPEGSRWHTALMNHRHIKRQESFSPTHWRPLPASPAKGERT